LTFNTTECGNPKGGGMRQQNVLSLHLYTYFFISYIFTHKIPSRNRVILVLH